MLSPGFEGNAAAGRELDPAVGALDRDHDDSGQAADVGVAEGLAGKRTFRADRDLVHLDGQARSLGDQLHEFNRRGVGEQRDDPLCTNGRRRDHVVCPGLAELLLGAGLLGAGDDLELGASSLAVSVMNTLAASLGMAVTSTLARLMPASLSTASSVASPSRCRKPLDSIARARS